MVKGHEKINIAFVIDKHIHNAKKNWIVACRCRSVESMAVNSSIIYHLLEIKQELGLLTEKAYYEQLVTFDNWKKEKSFSYIGGTYGR